MYSYLSIDAWSWCPANLWWEQMCKLLQMFEHQVVHFWILTWIRECVSSWNKWNKNSKISSISLLSSLFYFKTTHNEIRGMECSSGSSTINKSNIMCVRISFEICVKRALLNYTHKQQDTIKKNDNNFMWAS